MTVSPMHGQAWRTVGEDDQEQHAHIEFLVDDGDALDVKLDLGLADVLLVGGVGSHFGSRIRSHTGRAPPSCPAGAEARLNCDRKHLCIGALSERG